MFRTGTIAQSTSTQTVPCQSSWMLQTTLACFELTGVSSAGKLGQAERPTCPGCGAFLILALPPGGKGQRTFQCLDCERPDPLKTDQATGWLKGELQPPK